MPISAYLAALRQKIGNDLVLMPAVTALIRNAAGDLLLQRRADTGAWELPGGAIDPGERPAQALVREVYEETGLVVRPTRLVAVLGGHLLHYPNGDVVEYTTAYFDADIVRGRLAPLDGEATEARFFTAPELATVAPDALRRLLATGAAFDWDDGWLAVDTIPIVS